MVAQHAAMYRKVDMYAVVVMLSLQVAIASGQQDA
jgi:hypothetical protein